MALPSITTILVTYNSTRILPWSLPPLAHCQDVVVVDNASSDDTLACVRTLLPQARIVEAGRNLGFGRANNLGLASVTTDYALLLNPDARLAPDTLTRLAEGAARYPEAGILAPVLFDAPGVVGDFFRGPFFAPVCKPAPEPAGDLCTEFVTGAAMLINMRLVREVGFFDPWFFLYFEDDDLCLRVRQAGHAIIVLGDATVEHHTRESSVPSTRTAFRRVYCMTLSKLYLTRKVFGGTRWIGMALRIGMGSALSVLPQLLLWRKQRALKHMARLAAALSVGRHVGRAHCFEPED